MGNNGDLFTLMRKTEIERVLDVREAQVLGLEVLIKCLLDMHISMVNMSLICVL